MAPKIPFGPPNIGSDCSHFDPKSQELQQQFFAGTLLGRDYTYNN
jgi:hypothetical protein